MMSLLSNPAFYAGMSEDAPPDEEMTDGKQQPSPVKQGKKKRNASISTITSIASNTARRELYVAESLTRTDTFDSQATTGSVDEEEYDEYEVSDLEKQIQSITVSRLAHDDLEEEESGGVEGLHPSFTVDMSVLEDEKVLNVEVQNENPWETAMYVALFGILGAVLRAFIGRLFGLDCELGDDAVEDFMTPISRHVCITASGRTQQAGGALFTDLPANMIGSFLVGILCPATASVTGERLFPWLDADHPLNKSKSFFAGLKVGFCGCLTTFASWNAQMIVMLDGTATQLGPQIPTVLFGYLVGMACCVSSFLSGRHVYQSIMASHENNKDDDERKQDKKAILRADALAQAFSDETTTVADPSTNHHHDVYKLYPMQYLPMALVPALFFAFLLVDQVSGILFYRTLWISMLLSPFGSVLRWQLAKLNKRQGWWASLQYIPWGTLLANLIGAMLSIFSEAMDTQFVQDQKEKHIHVNWTRHVMAAIEAGLAGSLSTVSTFVKELFEMDNAAQAHSYWFGTVALAMILSLLIYSPIVRGS